MYKAAVKHRTWLAGIVSCALLAAIATASVTSKPDLDHSTIAKANDLSTAFRVTAKTVQPAVVSIVTKAKKPKQSVTFRGDPRGMTPDQLEEMFKGSPLEKFFGDRFRSRPQSFQPMARQGIGSGVIIDAKGVVLTNNHVVKDADEVMVRLHDGREFEAVEVRTDPETDLAVLRIQDAKNLVAARLGDSDRAEIGDWVLALGQPFGLEGTVTAGIISAKGRGIGITARENFLQTDAAINPGNSGGPLVNLRGEVVGINTAISSSTGGNQGIGFAIPINLAEWVSNQLLTKGSVSRAFLGVGIQKVDHDLASTFGLDSGRGVVVTEVRKDSPAMKAGLEIGDVILTFDNRDVSSPRALQMMVERCDPSLQYPVEVLRNGKTVTLEASCGAMPETRNVSHTGKTDNGNSLGLEVAELTNDIAKQLGIKGEVGVVITSVAPNSRAAEAGLSSGMVITQVDRKSIGTVAELREALDSIEENQSVLLLVRSEGGSRFVVVK